MPAAAVLACLLVVCFVLLRVSTHVSTPPSPPNTTNQVGRWRMALGLVGVVDVVLLLALLLGLFEGRLDRFWSKHVRK